MTKKAIVTGHSRGLGAALTSQLAAAGWEVLGVSRSAGAHVDLSDTAALTTWLDGGELASFVDGATEILLINNAGMLGPADLVGHQDPASAIAAVNVNVTAPILLTDAVIRHRRPGVPVRVVHISSGAGRRPLAGWSVYCATKAAVDLHATTVAAEKLDGVRIAAIAPGVVDTDMQGLIRSSDGFPARDDFVAMKERGDLLTPEESARRVLAIANGPDFGEKVLERV